MVNAYSDVWFGLFLASPNEERTAREVAFLQRHLPKNRFHHVVDLCCGYGRHAIPLATAGYRVLGIDRSAPAIDEAQNRSGTSGASFLEWPMERIGELGFAPDAVICMWQSFGYFDAATNSRILEQIAGMLRPGGKLVMDVYNREFFESRLGSRESKAGDASVVTTQSLNDDRLRVELEYSHGASDVFDWQVFKPAAFEAETERRGFQRLSSCADFDETVGPNSDNPRMQFVLERQ